MHNNRFSDSLKDFILNQEEKNESVGTFKNGKINNDYCFQHVIQQTYNRKKLFYPSGAAFYENKIKSLCAEYGIVLICQVVMPTHIHEIYYVEDIKKLSKMRAIACRSTSAFIRNEFKEKRYEVPSAVFERRPGYVAIKNRRQLLIALKYLRDNDLYLQKMTENGKPCKAPYSCFEHWRHGHVKYFFTDGLSSLFGLSLQELMDLLDSEMNRVMEIADKFKTREYQKQDEQIFKRQVRT